MAYPNVWENDQPIKQNIYLSVDDPKNACQTNKPQKTSILLKIASKNHFSSKKK